MKSTKELKAWYLKEVDLFKGLKEEEVKKLASKMIGKKCKKKEVLYTPFDTDDTIFFLKKGKVTLYHLYRGKKLIMDTLSAGSIFGSITFEPKKHTHYAEVTEDAFVCAFKIDEFIKVLSSKPELMLRFMRDMSMRIRKYEDKLKGGLFDAKEKIIHQLEMRECKRNMITKMFKRDCNLTHENLAELTGLSRETVTRAITALKKEGRIKAGVDGALLLHEQKT